MTLQIGQQCFYDVPCSKNFKIVKIIDAMHRIDGDIHHRHYTVKEDKGSRVTSEVPEGCLIPYGLPVPGGFCIGDIVTCIAWRQQGKDIKGTVIPALSKIRESKLNVYVNFGEHSRKLREPEELIIIQPWTDDDHNWPHIHPYEYEHAPSEFHVKRTLLLTNTTRDIGPIEDGQMITKDTSHDYIDFREWKSEPVEYRDIKLRQKCIVDETCSLDNFRDEIVRIDHVYNTSDFCTIRRKDGRADSVHNKCLWPFGYPMAGGFCVGDRVVTIEEGCEGIVYPARDSTLSVAVKIEQYGIVAVKTENLKLVEPFEGWEDIGLMPMNDYKNMSIEWEKKREENLAKANCIELSVNISEHSRELRRQLQRLGEQHEKMRPAENNLKIGPIYSPLYQHPEPLPPILYDTHVCKCGKLYGCMCGRDKISKN